MAQTPRPPRSPGAGVSACPAVTPTALLAFLAYVGGWGVPEHSVGNHRPPETGPGQRTGLVRTTTPGAPSDPGVVVRSDRDPARTAQARTVAHRPPGPGPGVPTSPTAR